MKRYVIKDEEGKVVEVSELEAGEKMPEAEAPKHDEEEGAAPAAPFTPEQMDAIRTIISEELAKLKPAEEHTPAPEGEAHDQEEMKEEEKEVKQACDSKGPAAVAELKAPVTDSTLNLEDERTNAWAKRYSK